MFRALRTATALTVAVVSVVTGCAGHHDGGTAAPRAGCIENFDPAADYFPDKQTVLDAANFHLEYHRSYQVLTVDQPHPDAAPVSYVLVRCGAPDPQLSGALAGAQRISTPVAGLYSVSTTQLGMLAELDRTDVVTGVADPALVTDAGVRERITAGRTVGFAPGGQITVEQVVAAHPDVLVTGGLDDAAHPTLRAAGIGVVADAEWLEPTPLGRAEWVKVLAALTGTERRAAQVYDGIRDRYRRTAALVGSARTAVLPGSLYQGTWSMPTGAGYAGRLITDAGGDYPWAHDTGAAYRQLNFESVYARAGTAPLWLVNQGWATLGQALAVDSRYGELAAVRDGGVWTAGGTGPGTDYWERGTARPDLVLADLVAVLHPDLTPEHRFEFYRRVPA